MGKEVPAKLHLFFLIQLCFIMEKTLSVWLVCPLCSFIYREDLLFKHSLKCREGCRSQIHASRDASDSSVQTVVKFWMGVCSKGEHSKCVMSNLDSYLWQLCSEKPSPCWQAVHFPTSMHTVFASLKFSYVLTSRTCNTVNPYWNTNSVRISSRRAIVFFFLLSPCDWVWSVHKSVKANVRVLGLWFVSSGTI